MARRGSGTSPRRPRGPRSRSRSGSVGPVVFLPDGRSLFTGGADGSIRRWDAADGHAQAFRTEAHSTARRGDGHCRRRSNTGQRRGRSPAQALGRGRAARAPAVRGRRGEGPIPGALARWQSAGVGHHRWRRSALGHESVVGSGAIPSNSGPQEVQLALSPDGKVLATLAVGSRLEFAHGSGIPPRDASWTIWRAGRSTPGCWPSRPTAGRWRRPAGRRP